MWIVVMFDLPVVEKSERKAATEFRNTLRDMGFEMSQFSVHPARSGHLFHWKNCPCKYALPRRLLAI